MRTGRQTLRDRLDRLPLRPRVHGWFSNLITFVLVGCSCVRASASKGGSGPLTPAVRLTRVTPLLTTTVGARGSGCGVNHKTTLALDLEHRRRARQTRRAWCLPRGINPEGDTLQRRIQSTASFWAQTFMASMFQIAVAGAHLSGLPLNHQLLELGACLVRSVRTAPVYRKLSCRAQIQS